jgi:hypothetical protein
VFDIVIHRRADGAARAHRDRLRRVAFMGAAACVGTIAGIHPLRDAHRGDPATAPSIATLGGESTTTAVIDTTPRTWLEMKNVNLRVANDAVVGVRQLRGEVIPTARGSSAILDSTGSFSIRITSGTVALASADLGVILNRFVFGYKGSPLKHLRVHMSGAELVQTGTLHKGIDIHFEITATPSLTDSGFIRLHPKKVRVLGVNGESLLHALGLHLENLLDLSKSAAARVKGDDIYLDPSKILPPPAIVGRLVSVRVQGDALVQEFTTLPDDSVFDGYARADSVAPNYLFFRGGRLRFGRLEMRDTQLQILDLDPSDPFDLFLAQYNQQLSAGYSRNRPNLALQAFFPDFTDLGHPVSAPVVAARRMP